MTIDVIDLPGTYSLAPRSPDELVAVEVVLGKTADAKPDVIYRWVFSSRYRNPNTFLYNTGQVTSLNDPDLNFRQTYDLIRINRDNGTQKTVVNDAVSAPSNVGAASMPNYNSGLFDAATEEFGAAPSKTWAGQSDDAFFLDLRVFDLLYGADLSEVGDDTLAGFNVNTRPCRFRRRTWPGPGTWTRTRSSASGARRRAGASGSRTRTARPTATASSSRSRAWACRS